MRTSKRKSKYFVTFTITYANYFVDRAKRSALWKSFQKQTENVPTPTTENTENDTMVKIQRKYRFAGEDFT